MNLSEINNFNLTSRSVCEAQPKQFEVEFNPQSGILWGWFNQPGIPCFNLSMLNEIREHDSMLEMNKGHVLINGTLSKVNYYVVGSKCPQVFNLGGDLALFHFLIKAGERDALRRYATLCIDNIYPRIRNYFSPTMTTISLIQGDALGGGFETAMASDILIAEESARLGLPEILFNLFPGMGAYSLLARRIGMRAAERLITDGNILSAKELHEMGVIDVLAKDGTGKTAVEDWISTNQRRQNGFQAVMNARQCFQPIEREELDKIVELWVEAALRLEEKDLKMISRIIRSQDRRIYRSEPAAKISVVAA